MTESKIDDKIQQCESNIESLQENLEKLRKQRKENKKYIFKIGDVAINKFNCCRVIVEKVRRTGCVVAVDHSGYFTASEDQSHFENYEYKKITTLKEVIDFWRENHV